MTYTFVIKMVNVISVVVFCHCINLINPAGKIVHINSTFKPLPNHISYTSYRIKYY